MGGAKYWEVERGEMPYVCVGRESRAALLEREGKGEQSRITQGMKRFW